MVKGNKHSYGFKTNLHQKPTESTIRVEFIEKHINSNYLVTVKSFIISVVAIVVPAIGLLLYLSTNLIRSKYLLLPTVTMLIGMIILILQYMFKDPGQGSLLSWSMRFAKSLWSYRRVRTGKKRAFRNAEIHKIRKDGIAQYQDGSIGKVFNVDGATSQTAFPEEVLAQEELSRSYQNARKSNVTEIKITSSQPQSTERQLKNMATQKRDCKDNEAIYDIVQQQENFVKLYIDGKRTTAVQYLVVKAKSEMVLDEYVKRLESYTNNGLYYSLSALNRKDAEELITDIYNLK